MYTFCVKIRFHFSDTYLGVTLWGHVLTLGLVIWGPAILLAKVATPFCISISNTCRFLERLVALGNVWLFIKSLRDMGGLNAVPQDP